VPTPLEALGTISSNLQKALITGEANMKKTTDKTITAKTENAKIKLCLQSFILDISDS
jgi:hypothetical protein